MPGKKGSHKPDNNFPPITPDAALNLLSPYQQMQLSPDAKNLLSRIPAIRQDGTPDWAGVYNSNGKYMLYNTQAGFPATEILLHESLHAIDDFSGNSKSKNFPIMSPELREKIYEQYYLGKPKYTNENHISNVEAYAQTGERGYYNIPQELKPYYYDVFSGVAVPRFVKAQRARYNSNHDAETNTLPSAPRRME